MYKIVFTYTSGGLTNKGKEEKITITNKSIEYRLKWFSKEPHTEDNEIIQHYNFDYRIERVNREDHIITFIEKIISLAKEGKISPDRDILNIQITLDRMKTNMYVPLYRSPVLVKVIGSYVFDLIPPGFRVPEFLVNASMKLYHSDNQANCENI